MKRITWLTVASILFSGSLFASNKLKVVTTTQDLASITREVGGDRVDVTSIARGYQDPHFVEPKPSFLLLLKNADLLEVVGLELEIGWLPPLLDQCRNNNIRPGTPGYLDLSQGVEILDRPSVVNRSMGDVHAYGIDTGSWEKLAAPRSAGGPRSGTRRRCRRTGGPSRPPADPLRAASGAPTRRQWRCPCRSRCRGP